MCKEADEAPAAAEEVKKVKIPKGLPEPGKPVQPPQDVLFTPTHSSALSDRQPTIANASAFSDKDLSAISE